MKSQSLHVLMVEDSEDDIMLVIRDLKKGGYNPVYERVETAAEMKKALKGKQWDIILCDYKMPKFSGPSAIAVLEETNIDIPLIIVSGAMSEEAAVECMRLGANDYIMKGNLSRLCPAIDRELKEVEVRIKHKQSEDARREIEERYQELFNHISSGVAVYEAVDNGGDFIFRDFNPAAEKIEKISRKDILGKRVTEVFPGVKAFGVFEVFQRVWQTGNTEYFPQNIYKDERDLGSWRDNWVFKLPTGEIVAVYNDITDRKRAEEELKESENKYRLSFENVTDVVYTIDNDLNVSSVSPSVERVLGYKPQDFIGQPVSNLGNILTPESFEQAIVDINSILKGETISATIYRFIAKDGTIKYGEVSGSPLMRKGKIIGIISVARDITDRKLVEEALRASEKKYRDLYDFLPIPIYEMDLEANITSANRAIYETFRGTEADLKKGFKAWQILSPEEIEKSSKNIQRLLKGEQIAGTEYNLMRSDGSVFPAIVISSVIYSDGKPVGLRGAIIDITQRKQMEETLRQNEEKYRSILETIQEGYYEVDLAGNLTFFNDSLRRILGYSKEELMGMNYRRYEDKESLKKVFQMYNKVYKTGEPIKGFGRQIIRKDGTKRYVEVSVSLQKDSSGKPIGFTGISHDVTERKQMEDVISESEERYRTILDEMDNGYFEVDLAGNYTFINDANCRQLGYSKEEIIGLNFRVPMVKESIEIVYNAFKNIYITGKPQRGISYRARRKDGSTGVAEISGFPLKNKSGETIGFRGIALDVTERKRVEDALRESEEKYRTILEDMDDVYFEVDIRGNITFVNHSSCKMSGYSEKELLGMPFKKISAPDGIEMVIQYFGEIFLTGKTGKPFLWKLVKKNGEQGFFEIVASLIRDKQGKPIGFRGIGRDITERKRAEEVLQQALASLRKAFGTTIQVMVSAVEMRDPYTSGHQIRSADIARAIATEMGLPRDKIDGIRLAGSIHDIGKLSVPAEILAKPTKLTDLEFSLIKEHPQVGYEMLKDVESPWPLAQIVYQHHERMNGSGYPRNLKGDEIILEARIMAVADVVEAMASHRPYRPGLGIEAALEEIEKNRGILYDAAVAEACLRLFREKNYQIR